MIDAKPCYHGGYLMRSRAECVWARLFDSLRIDYAYEPGLWMTRHGGYVPDFQVLAAGAFFEVKGQEPSQVELEKADDLMAATGMPVIFGYGIAAAGVFNGWRLPMGLMFMAKRAGRWVKVPMTLIGELVLGCMGEIALWSLVTAAERGEFTEADLPDDRAIAERLIADRKAPANAQKLEVHRTPTRGEHFAGRAIAWLAT